MLAQKDEDLPQKEVNLSAQNKQKEGAFLQNNNYDDIGFAPPPVEENFAPAEEIPVFDPNYESEKRQNVVLEQKYDVSKLSAKQIWGVLLLKLKQGGFATLHTAGGEIRDLERNGNLLTVRVREDYLYSILTSEKNFANIKNMLKQIDSSLEIEFVQKKLSKDNYQKNFETLKNLFGDFLTEEQTP